MKEINLFMIICSAYSISFGIISIVLSAIILTTIFDNEDIFENNFFVNWNKNPIVSF